MFPQGEAYQDILIHIYSIAFMIYALVLCSLILTSTASRQAIKTAVVDVRSFGLYPGSTLNFTLRNLDPSKTLMVTLKDHRQPSLAPFELQIQNKDHEKAICNFTYATNLCVMQKSTGEVTIRVKCKQKTCTATLIVSQRLLVKEQAGQKLNRQLFTPGEVFRLARRNFTSLLQIYSEREQHKLLAQQIAVHSNIHAFQLEQIEELDSTSAVFGLKPVRTDADQYLFVESDKHNTHDLRLTLRTHAGLLHESVALVDFVQTFGRRSKNDYTYAGTLVHNVQVNLRVFAPRDNATLPLALAIRGHNPNIEPVDIRRLHIASVDFRGQRFYDLSFIVARSQHIKYSIVSFQVVLEEVVDRAIFIEVEVRDTEHAEISILDDVFFGMDKDEHIVLAVEPHMRLTLADGDKTVPVRINAEEGYFASTQVCSLLKGCQIEIKAGKACDYCSLRFDLIEETVRNHILYYEVAGDTIEGKVQVDEELFFRYSMEAHSSVQIAVDSVNVILYASFDNYDRCQVPKPNCHQYVVNHQNPMRIRSTSQQPTELLLSVLGLEKTVFRVRFIKQANELTLKLRDKFTYLFNNEQTSLTLMFVLDRTTLPTSNHLTFTLVAPVGSLRLQVINTDGLSMTSSDGFLAFPIKKILGNNFEITVYKIGQFSNDFIHMTLVVDTQGNTVRLDRTSTHYQRYAAGEQKTFLIEYDSSEINALNIFTEDLQKTHGNMSLTVREVSLDPQSLNQPLFTKILSRDLEFIDLDLELQEKDVCSEVNCELEISIVNKMMQFLEQSLTLLAEDSVIELSDSIWTGFQINQLSRTTHFYYLPRQFNQSTTIIFQTDDRHLYVNYRIHNTSNSISPADWPFQRSQKEEVGRISGSQVIDIPAADTDMQACWPTCVVLINVNEVHTPNEDIAKQHSLIQTYKILATNSIIEFPEETKLQFALATGEAKSLFILVKNFLKIKSFTFFTYFALGRGTITASLVSGDKQFALGPKGKEFVFDSLETDLQLQLINQLINSQYLKPEQTFLKVTITADSHLKMTIEFSSYLHDIYRLHMDDLQVATLRKGEQMWYQFVPQRDFTIKFYRLRGFPFLKVIRCEEQNYLDCLNKHKKLLKMQVLQKLQTEEVVKNNDAPLIVNEPTKTHELEVLVEKNLEVEHQFCERCIYFVWIYCFEGDLQLSLNVRTRYSEVELKEMNVIDERVQPQQHARYLINADPCKQTVITIRILEGTAQVEAADTVQSLFKQALNSIDDDYRDIVIEASDFPKSKQKDQQQKEQQQGQEDTEGMPHDSAGQPRRPKAHSVLRHIHVKVTATSDQPVQFLMSYSVGESSLYLEDGIVSQKRLIPEIPHTFYYHNHERKSHAYLTLSSQIEPGYTHTNPVNELDARFYYYPDASNRNERQSFIPQLPPNRNQNYFGSTRTAVYELPSKFELMQVEVESKYYLRVTASINHKELVYLPLGFEYLIKLHPLESLHLVVNRPDSDYLQIKIKKCDQSMPSLYYTNDARQFKNGMFTTEVDIQTNSFQQFIKTKPSSKTIHLKIIGDTEIDTILIVTVTAANQQQKSTAPHYRPGSKGLLSYKVLPSNQVEVSFKPISCDQKECSAPATYYLLVADRAQDVFGELNCAGHYFMKQANPLSVHKRAEVMTIQENSFDKTTGEYHYLVKITNSRAYLGVKAIVADGSYRQITYVPLEISSLWGELSKVSLGVVMLAALGLSMIITVVIVLSTRLARRGYRPITNQE